MKVLLLLALFVISIAQKPEQKAFGGLIPDVPASWQCGSNKLIFRVSVKLSYLQMYWNCRPRIDRVNNCCIVHDECYNKQGGLVECNHNFYECMDNATLDYCPVTGKLFKAAVHSLGRISYGRKSMQKALAERKVLLENSTEKNI